MKFYLAGSHRTGKTSLALELAKSYSIEYIKSDIGGLLKDMGYTNSDQNVNNNDPENFIKTQSVIASYLNFLTAGKEDFVVDRSLFDVIGYIKYWMLCNGYSCNQDQKQSLLNLIRDINRLIDIADSKKDTYVCLPSPNIEFEHDEKSGGVDSQEGVSAFILHDAFANDLNIIPVNCATPVERVNSVMMNRVKRMVNNFSKVENKHK